MIWDIDDQKATIEGLDADGRPDPAYAATLGLVRAPFGRRALSATVDAAIWLLLLLPALIGATPLVLKLATGAISPYGFVNHPDFLLAVILTSISTGLGLVYLIVQWLLHGMKGLTIGKALTGIRSVNVRTLERPRVGAVFVRFVILVASGIIPVLGPAFVLASPAFDPEGRGRGLHDKASGVWLVDVRKGLDPYNQKRMRVARKTVKAEPVAERSALPSLATPTDPDARPEYRPGGRVSAGVLGIARPDARERPAIGPVAPAPAVPTPAGLAAPVSTPVGAAAPAAESAGRPAAAVVEPAVEQSVTPASGNFGLRFDSGESIPVSEPVLLGRNPDSAEHPGARAIALADDSRSLSKTHMRVTPIDGGLEIVDCRSTNGSGLIRGGTEYAVTAGVPVATTEGDTIRLGDRTAAVVRL
jgi:uncharacterized RDD family membrane protein YckC